MNKPDIYKYDDFRLYLKDCYQFRSLEIPKYSYRKFAREAGFTNPGYINDVIKGNRTLSKSALDKVCRVFNLNQKESEFLGLLVNYGQTKKENDKEECYRQILFRRSRSAFTRLNPALVRYYQDYRYPLVRSAIEVKDFRGNYESLSRFLSPPLPTTLLKKIIRDLCDWGLIQQKPNGQYVITQKFIEPPETMAQLIRQLNREWITQGKDALSRFSPEERHISSILLGISRQTKEKIRRKIDLFRQEIFDLIETDSVPEVLMQLSIQYFPKSATEIKS
ncbi:MAG: TIGR02147 family protein [Fibrobacteria bacterium]|nr:TIGR02147 family protein [Fibrobacteria bacterium]